jgi:hypothetical protein
MVAAELKCYCDLFTPLMAADAGAPYILLIVPWPTKSMARSYDQAIILGRCIRLISASETETTREKAFAYEPRRLSRPEPARTYIVIVTYNVLPPQPPQKRANSDFDPPCVAQTLPGTL